MKRPLSDYLVEAMYVCGVTMLFVFSVVGFMDWVATGSVFLSWHAIKMAYVFSLMLTPAFWYALYAMFGPKVSE